MGNDYEIQGPITKIILKRRNGEKVIALIETSDLEKVLKFPGTWTVKWSNKTNTYYVHAFQRDGEKKTTVMLHRYLMNPDKDKMVDHINHDTLDNRRSNLRIVTHAENQFNRAGSQANNKSSGLRNIYYDKKLKKWRVIVQINNKKHHFGRYKDLEEAKTVAEKARKELLGGTYEPTTTL